MANPTNQGMNNLTTLIKRLEAATSRLEDIASSSATLEAAHPATVTATSISHDDVSPRDSLNDDAKPNRGATSERTGQETLPKTIVAIDDLLSDQLAAFVHSSANIDPLVEEQAVMVSKAFKEQRRFLYISTRARKPDLSSPQVFNALLSDLQKSMGAVSDVKDRNRSSPMKEHLAMASEGVEALQWLMIDGKPSDYVGEVIGGTQMYGNRVLKAYKQSAQSHVEYVQAYYSLLRALQAYILEHFPLGLTWNTTGGDAVDINSEIADASDTPLIAAPPALDIDAAAASQSKPAPPPPPPPPPLPTIVAQSAASTERERGGADMGAVFQQLNRGEAITAALKKVETSQMTHKNPSLRTSGVVKDTRSKSPGPDVKPKPASMRQNSNVTVSGASGKRYLDGNKWIVENWDSPGSPIMIDVSITQSILITKCKNTTIVLRGKANAVSIDNCPRLQIVVDTLISSVDIIKSQNIALQVNQTVPAILLDQVDGATIYVSAEDAGTEILTSKCSSINIVMPPSSTDGDSSELPIPEQIRTLVERGTIKSEIVQHVA